MRPRARARSIFKSDTPPAVIHLPDQTTGAPRPKSGQKSGPRSGKTENKTILKRRLSILLAAIAVPAMAAPGDFGALPGNAIGSVAMAEERDAKPVLQPFETPGQSFPGSAFYFLADPPAAALIALPSSDPLVTEPGSSNYGELIDVGAAANPFRAKMSGTSLSRAMHCLTQAVYYEAASESTAGQRAVAQVVLNRLAHSSWPNSVCGVVFEGSQRSTGCQFTFTCDGSLTRKPSQTGWQRARKIASDALSGEVYEPIGLATHYHTHWVNPYWASSLDHIGTVGAHRFYKTRGRGGGKSAFSMAHAGVEPNVAERGARRAQQAEEAPRRTVPSSAAPYSAATASTPPSGTAAPVISTPVNPAMQAAGQVKQEYAQSGQWKNSMPGISITREAAQEFGQNGEQ